MTATTMMLLRSSAATAALGVRPENQHHDDDNDNDDLPSNSVERLKKQRRATQSKNAPAATTIVDDGNDPTGCSKHYSETYAVPSSTPQAPLSLIVVPSQNPPDNNKRRRSSRDTNKLKLSDRTSLHYRRLQEIFFQEQSSRHCRDNTQLSLGNYTLQRVSQSPNIWIVDDFLNATELHYLHQIASTHRFQRSYVDQIEPSSAVPAAAGDNTADATATDSHGEQPQQHASGSHYDDSHRTSTFLSFPKQQDATISRIETKAAELLGCWCTRSIEPLQLVRYTPGQFFGVHHDMGDYNEETGEVALPPKSWFSKRRVVTLFCYLNRVDAGGATYFPIPNVRVEPVPGRAVLFCNVLPTGQPDPRTIHAGEAVREGTKYGLNIWICED